MLRQNCALAQAEKQIADSMKKAHIQPLFYFNFY